MENVFRDKMSADVYRATVKKTVQLLSVSRDSRSDEVSQGLSSGRVSSTQSKLASESAAPKQPTRSSSTGGIDHFARGVAHSPVKTSAISVPSTRHPSLPNNSPSCGSNAIRLLSEQQLPLSQSGEDYQGESRASKRARQMHSLCSEDIRRKAGRMPSGGSPVRPKQDAQSQRCNPAIARGNGGGILSKLDNIELAHVTSDRKMLVGDTSKLQRLTCVVCSDSPPHVPCVAKCGHVCCKGCWEQWLKVKSACPYCRSTTSAADIARVIVA